jgi:hypothetical protein
VSITVRAASIGELPPGKGKVVELADRQLIVYNLDGRLYARATRRWAHALPHGDTATECTQHGLLFDVCAEDSPARLRADERSCQVRIKGDAVWLIVES